MQTFIIILGVIIIGFISVIAIVTNRKLNKEVDIIIEEDLRSDGSFSSVKKYPIRKVLNSSHPYESDDNKGAKAVYIERQSGNTQRSKIFNVIKLIGDKTETVSAKHACLLKDDDGFYLKVNTATTNGTSFQVGNAFKEIEFKENSSTSIEIKNDQIVRLGKQYIRFVIPQSATSGGTIVTTIDSDDEDANEGTKIKNTSMKQPANSTVNMDIFKR